METLRVACFPVGVRYRRRDRLIQQEFFNGLLVMLAYWLNISD
ncbi:hypothetical protein [uncultured Nostoc sp.]|nr:hypothetical protein [uncultured Nostoc sp.]